MTAQTHLGGRRYASLESRLAIFVAATLVSLLGQLLPVGATHIPNSQDVDRLRPPMPFEGYLNFRHAAGPGDERTGWTDIRHPALDGTVDTRRGYDWSDNQVVVLTHNVRVDPPAGAAGDTTVTAPLRRQDFDVTNATYAQAGIGVREEGNRDTFGHDIVRDASGDQRPSVGQLFGIDRSPNANTVNAYYVDNIPGARGITLSPEDRAAFVNDGFAVADDKGSGTFAHELGHYLLDSHRFPGGAVHSPQADDLMNAAPVHPNAAAHKLPAESFGLREPGQSVGNIGTHLHLDENVTLPPAPAMVTQTESFHRSPFVQEDDNGATHGDRADFDWVEDNIALQLATTSGDNHPGVDFLIWEIGAIAGSAHEHNGRDTNFAHDHDAWGELGLNAFDNSFFRTIDIVSQIARYADMDVDSAGNWSARESALDFRGGNAIFPEFSFDGISWLAGSLINVFVPGWHLNLTVRPEDYVSRWLSPIDARFLRLAAFQLGGEHDGNTQIDAIIASRSIVSSIPEPATLVLFTIGLLGIASCGRWLRGFGT